MPVLGSIPILGRLFRYEASEVLKSNLMVFLRAEIIRDDDIMNAATAEKYELIRDMQKKQRDQGLVLMDDELIPVLPGHTFPAPSNSSDPVSTESETE